MHPMERMGHPRVGIWHLMEQGKEKPGKAESGAVQGSKKVSKKLSWQLHLVYLCTEKPLL